MSERPVITSTSVLAAMTDSEAFEAALEAAQNVAANALIGRLCSTDPAAVVRAAGELVRMPSYRRPERTEVAL